MHTCEHYNAVDVDTLYVSLMHLTSSGVLQYMAIRKVSQELEHKLRSSYT